MNNIWTKALAVALISIAFAFLTYFFSDIAFPTLNISLTKDTFIEGYFNHANEQKPLSDPNKNIILFDSSDLEIDSKVASIIDSIVACKPKVLGIDVLWNSTKGVDSDAVSRLDSAIHKAHRKMSAYGGYLCLNSDIWSKDYLDKSYFVDQELYSTLAFANADGINLFFPQKESVTRAVRLGADSLYLSFFPYQIASFYLERDISEFDFNKLGINYLPKESFHSNSILADIVKDSLENRIVILGDSQDRKDMHLLPCEFNKAETMTENKTCYLDGLNYNAYIVNTLISLGDKTVHRANQPYRKGNLVFDLVIGIVLLYLYCLVSQVLCVKKTYSKNKRIVLYIGKPVFMVIYSYIIIHAGYLLIDRLFYVPDFFLYLLAIVFVGFAERIVTPDPQES